MYNYQQQQGGYTDPYNQPYQQSQESGIITEWGYANHIGYYCGKVKSDRTGEKIFLDERDFKGHLSKGDRISFTVIQGPRGSKASNISKPSVQRSGRGRRDDDAKDDSDNYDSDDDNYTALGETIELRSGKIGTIRFIGPVHFGKGNWIGVELHDEWGPHDGAVRGVRYFTCPPKRGKFVKQYKQSKVFDLMEKNNQLMEEKNKLMEQNILVQQQVAMLQTQLQSKEDQNTANAIQIDKLRTERDNALRTMRKIREKNEIPILSATVKRLQKEIQEKDNKIHQLVKQHNDHVRSSKNKLNEVEHECKELQIQNKQLQQENEELRANQMVMDESQYLSWNNNDVGRWILSLNKKYKKYEQTLMNELEEEGICGQTLCYVKIMDITNWGIKNIVSRQDVFENIQRILRHNPQQKVRNAVEGIPTAYI